MDDTVADGLDLGKVVQNTDSGVHQFGAEGLERVGVVLDVDLGLRLIRARTLVDEIGVVQPDALDVAFGQHRALSVFHPENSELERRTASVDNQDFHDVTPGVRGETGAPAASPSRCPFLHPQQTFPRTLCRVV